MIRQDVWLEFTEEGFFCTFEFFNKQIERTQYNELEGWAQDMYDDLIKSQMLTQKFQKILYILCRLRQACDHHLLQQGYEVTSKMLEYIKKKYNIEDVLKKKEKKEENDYDFTEFDDTFEMKKISKKRKKAPIVCFSFFSKNPN